MSQRHTISDYFVPPNSAASKLDVAIEVILAALICFMPWTLGVIEWWSREIVYLGATLMLALVLLRQVLSNDRPFVWTWAYLPMLLFIAWAALQLIPLPVGWIGVISPHSL